MAVPVDLLDIKLSTYMITPHGATMPGDANTTTIPDNMHVFAQGVRKDTYYKSRVGYEVAQPRFSGIRYLWKEAQHNKYSINDLIDTQMKLSGLDDPSYNRYAYFPPGSKIRNLRLTRDIEAYNIDGVFKLGEKKPCALLRQDPIYFAGPKSYDPAQAGEPGKPAIPGIPARAGVPAIPGFPAVPPIPASPAQANNTGQPYLVDNQTKTAITFIANHGNKDEQKIVLILSCASDHREAGQSYGLSAGEGELQAGTIQNTAYDSTAKEDKITKVPFLPQANLKSNIKYILEHNILYNNILHIGIDRPIPCVPLRAGGELCFRFRSKKAFNSLLNRTNKVRNPSPNPEDPEYIEPEYLLIRDGNIEGILERDIATKVIPYTLVKIPTGFNRYLYSPNYNMIQFFKAYNPDTGAIMVPPENPFTPVVAPVVLPGPVGAPGILGGSYYDKYLKYKNKYLTIKNQ